MNTIITRRKIKSPIPQRFKDGQEETKDPGISAHKFGEYFTNLVPSLAKKIPDKTFSYWFFWGNQILESCCLNPVPFLEIERLATLFNLAINQGFTVDKIMRDCYKHCFGSCFVE